MYIEFIYPANSYEIIETAEAECVPRASEIVSINGTDYLVKSVQYIHMAFGKYKKTINPIVNLEKLGEI